MKDRLCLVFCDYFQQEIEWILEQDRCKDVKLVFYHADCDRVQQSHSVLEAVVKQSVTDSVIIFAGNCLTSLLKQLPSKQLHIEQVSHCLELLIPESILESLLDQGAHLFTSGMLEHWEEVSQNWGFDNKERLDFFRESTQKLVLISNSHVPADTKKMAVIAKQLDLPWEIQEISLEYLAFRIFKIINHWRGEIIVDKKRQLADYAMVNDLIGNIATLKEEHHVITQVLELFHMFCEPASACYLPLKNGQPCELRMTNLVIDKTFETQRLLKVTENYALDRPNNGFQLLIKSNDETIGIFGIHQVAFPQYLNHYLNLARNIAPVIALAVGNARIYQQQLQAENNIRDLNSQLQKQLDTVNHLNKELESFTYSVSHDLRNPLSMIDSFLKILQRDYEPKLDARGVGLINRVMNNSKRMSELIEDLLRLSRLTRTELKLDTVNISQVATEIAHNLQQAQPERNVEFDIVENLYADADRSLLKVVLENLLGNAWKYTSHKEHAKIEINQLQENGEMVFFIKDNGAGFNMEQVEDLFAPFRRLHSSEEFPGSGIGLATVQRIIARHGGKIWAIAEPEKGACFYFTFA